MARHFVLTLCAATLAALLVVSTGATARAECPNIPPYPPVTEAARSAHEIIVGTVLEHVEGQIYDFRLRIDHVLRGPARVGEVRSVKGLYPNWPLLRLEDGTTIGPCESITASPGNVIAIAYGALAPDGKTRYNAVSWIAGTPEYRDSFETTTLAALQALAELPRTDAAPRSPAATPARTWSGATDQQVVILGLFAAAAVLGLDRRSRSVRRSDSDRR